MFSALLCDHVSQHKGILANFEDKLFWKHVHQSLYNDIKEHETPYVFMQGSTEEILSILQSKYIGSKLKSLYLTSLSYQLLDYHSFINQLASTLDFESSPDIGPMDP